MSELLAAITEHALLLVGAAVAFRLHFKSDRFPEHFRQVLLIAGTGLLLFGAFGVADDINKFRKSRQPVEVTSQLFLEAVANKTNEECPLEVDEETSLTGVVAFEGRLVYNFRLVNTTESQFYEPSFEEVVKPRALAALCSVPDSKENLFRQGVKVRYQYFNSEGEHLSGFEMNAEECKPNVE